jgi:hypothetical protein
VTRQLRACSSFEEAYASRSRGTSIEAEGMDFRGAARQSAAWEDGQACKHPFIHPLLRIDRERGAG